MVLMVFIAPLNAQTYFHKYLEPIFATNIFQNDDGTYRLIGMTAYVNGGDPTDIIFIKLDSLGNVIFRKDISSSYFDDNIYMIQKNNSFLIGGSCGGGGDTGKIKLAEIDLDGNVIWHGKYGNQRNLAMYTKSLTIDNNNNIISIAANPFTDSQNKRSIYLFKTDSLGTLQWSKVFFKDSLDIGCLKAFNSIDGGYFILGGYCISPLPCEGNPFLMKIDENGSILWVKYFSAENKSKYDFLFSHLQSLSNGNITLIGSYIDTIALERRFLFTTLNSLGEVISSKAISYNSFLSFLNNNIIQTQDSGYAFTTQSGTWTTELFKLDKNLNFEWIKINDNIANVTNLQQTSDGGFVYSGQIPNLVIGNNPYVGIIKTDKYGNSGCFERDTFATTYPVMVYDSVFTLQSYNEGFQSPSSTTEFFSPMQSYTHCFCSVTGGFTFTVNGDTVEFTNTSVGASAYTWNFGDGNTSANFSPTHVYDTAGTYQVSLIVQDGICVDTVFATITIVGVEEIENPLNFSVYPNPSFSTQVQFTTTEHGIYQLQIIDLAGKLIDNISFTGKQYNYKSKHLSTGLYFYELTNQNNVKSRGKLVKR